MGKKKGGEAKAADVEADADESVPLVVEWCFEAHALEEDEAVEQPEEEQQQEEEGQPVEEEEDTPLEAWKKHPAGSAPALVGRAHAVTAVPSGATAQHLLGVGAAIVLEDGTAWVAAPAEKKKKPSARVLRPGCEEEEETLVADLPDLPESARVVRPVASFPSAAEGEALLAVGADEEAERVVYLDTDADAAELLDWRTRALTPVALDRGASPLAVLRLPAGPAALVRLGGRVRAFSDGPARLAAGDGAWDALGLVVTELAGVSSAGVALFTVSLSPPADDKKKKKAAAKKDDPPAAGPVPVAVRWAAPATAAGWTANDTLEFRPLCLGDGAAVPLRDGVAHTFSLLGAPDGPVRALAVAPRPLHVRAEPARAPRRFRAPRPRSSRGVLLRELLTGDGPALVRVTTSEPGAGLAVRVLDAAALPPAVPEDRIFDEGEPLVDAFYRGAACVPALPLGGGRRLLLDVRFDGGGDAPEWAEIEVVGGVAEAASDRTQQAAYRRRQAAWEAREQGRGERAEVSRASFGGREARPPAAPAGPEEQRTEGVREAMERRREAEQREARAALARVRAATTAADPCESREQIREAAGRRNAARAALVAAVAAAEEAAASREALERLCAAADAAGEHAAADRLVAAAVRGAALDGDDAQALEWAAYARGLEPAARFATARAWALGAVQAAGRRAVDAVARAMEAAPEEPGGGGSKKKKGPTREEAVAEALRRVEQIRHEAGYVPGEREARVLGEATAQ